MNATQLLAHFDRLAEAPGAVPRLRRFILDLAVRGKLVRQDAGDEPAAGLLMRIQTERFRALNKPVKREALLGAEPESTDIQLPVGWVWSKLGNLCTKTGSGSTPAGGKDAYVSSGVPFLRSQNVYDDGLRLDGVAFISEATQERMSSTTVKAGDLLLNITGGSIGRCAIVPDSFVIGNINQHVAIIRLALLESGRFLHSVICSDYFQKHIFGNQTGAGREGLPKNRMDEILIPVAPIAEQHRIVAKVDELMALCDQLETAQQERERRRDRLAAASLHRLNQPAADTTPEAQRENARFHLHHLPLLTTRPEHIKAMREVVLDAAFQGTLTSQDPGDGTGKDLVEKVLQLSLSAGRPGKKTNKRAAPTTTPDVEPAFPTPAVWGWADLQMLCEQIGDIDHKMPRAVDIGVPFLSARDLKDGGVLDFSNPKYISEDDFTRLSRKVLPMRHDIIYSRIGARLGKARLVEVDTRFLISYSCCLIRPKHEFIDKRYLQIFLDSHLALQQAHSGVQSIGVPDLGLGEIKAYRIPVPPVAEQHRIVVKVDELMALCAQLEAQLTTTQTDSRRLLESVLEAALAPA